MAQGLFPSTILAEIITNNSLKPSFGEIFLCFLKLFAESLCNSLQNQLLLDIVFVNIFL